MLKIIIIAIFFCTNFFASDVKASLQRASSIKNPEQMALKLLKFNRLLVENVHDKKQFTADDYQTIEQTIYHDAQALWGVCGTALLQIKTDQRTNCCTSCVQSLTALYIDMTTSGYEGSVHEKRHAHDHCKKTVESALDMVENYKDGKIQSFVMKRD